MRGSVFSVNQEFFIEHCCECGTPFAMTKELEQRRRNDKRLFYCPLGHGQSYTGPTEADKLRDEVYRKQQMLEAERARAELLERQRNDVARAHNRMRQRVKNGVCPCCNRTFQNLLRHMQTEHADLPTVRALREAFGLSQAQVAAEIGVSKGHISAAERGRHVVGYAKEAIDSWIERHAWSSHDHGEVEPS